MRSRWAVKKQKKTSSLHACDLNKEKKWEAQTGCASKAEMLLKLMCVFKTSAVENFRVNERSQTDELCAWSFVLRVHKTMGVGACFALACPHSVKIDLESSSLIIREEFSLHSPLIVGTCTWHCQLGANQAEWLGSFKWKVIDLIWYRLESSSCFTPEPKPWSSSELKRSTDLQNLYRISCQQS